MFGRGSFGSSSSISSQSPSFISGPTDNPPYSPYSELENGVTVRYTTISAMPAYRTRSLEELRLEDYAKGRKGKPTGPSSSLMNVNNTANAGGFGGSASSSFFGAPKPPTSTFGGPSSSNALVPFGSTAPSSSSNLTGPFGQPQTQLDSFMKPPASGPAFGAFGASSAQTPAFGSGTGTAGFGTTSTTNSGTSGFFVQPTTTTGFSGGSTAGGFGMGGSFGSTPTPAFGSASTGFGSTSTPSSSSAFGGTVAPVSVGGFGATTTPSSTGNSGFGGTPSFGFGSASTAPSAFGATTSAFGTQPSSATGSSGFGFGKSLGTQQQPFAGFGTRQQSSAGTGGFGTAVSGASSFGQQPSSLFGGQQPQQASFGTFGTQPASSVATSSALFGSKPPPTSPAASSLFGGGGTQPAGQQPQPFSFTQQTQQQASGAGGLFPTAQPAAAVPAQSALFGQGSGGGLFGQPQQPTPQLSVGGFGQQQPQPATTAPQSLFAQPQPPSTTTTAGGLFGQQPPAPSPAFPSFSSTTAPPTSSSIGLGSGGLFGGAAGSSSLFAQPQQTSSGLGGSGGSLFGMQQRPQPPASAMSSSFPSLSPDPPAILSLQTKPSAPAKGESGLFRASPVKFTPRIIIPPPSSFSNTGIVSRPNPIVTSAASTSGAGGSLAETVLVPRKPLSAPSTSSSLADGPQSKLHLVIDPSNIAKAHQSTISNPEDRNNNYNDGTSGLFAQKRFGDYYTLPSLESVLSSGVEGVKAVSGFVVGQHGIGQVSFLEPVDLTSVLINNEKEQPGNKFYSPEECMRRLFTLFVQFEPGKVTVYPQEHFSETPKRPNEPNGGSSVSMLDTSLSPTISIGTSDDEKKIGVKPGIGQGLNTKARIRLDRCWPLSRSTRQPITDPTSPAYQAHLEKLRSGVPGTKFVEFVAESGTWVFEVEHF